MVARKISRCRATPFPSVRAAPGRWGRVLAARDAQRPQGAPRAASSTGNVSWSWLSLSPSLWSSPLSDRLVKLDCIVDTGMSRSQWVRMRVRREVTGCGSEGRLCWKGCCCIFLKFVHIFNASPTPTLKPQTLHFKP